jgi:hypothetical protein
MAQANAGGRQSSRGILGTGTASTRDQQVADFRRGFAAHRKRDFSSVGMRSPPSLSTQVRRLDRDADLVETAENRWNELWLSPAAFDAGFADLIEEPVFRRGVELRRPVFAYQILPTATLPSVRGEVVVSSELEGQKHTVRTSRSLRRAEGPRIENQTPAFVRLS